MTADTLARLAVYWAPPAGTALAEAGATWLGWDAHARAARPQPNADLAALTETPRRYGFHGTLKPPFRLADGRAAKDLAHAVAALGARTAPFEMPPLAVTTHLGFLALTPTAPCPALHALAADCVRDLDPLRAPLTDAERARRNPERLTAEEREYLDRWGYPHVLGRFRFHLTLSGRLESGALTQLAAEARAHFAGAIGQQVLIDQIAVFGDPGGGRPFHHLASHALTGGTSSG